MSSITKINETTCICDGVEVVIKTIEGREVIVADGFLTRRQMKEVSNFIKNK